MNKDNLEQFLKGALAEDLGSGDITTSSAFNSNLSVDGIFTCKSEGVIAGLDIAGTLYRIVNPDISFTCNVSDGDTVESGSDIAEVYGPVSELMNCERLALNILQRLSGIATRVREYVDKVEGTGARIMDTRKTIPGMRELEKYAVRMGGGYNHRMGLYDQVLIKDNHISYLKKHNEDLDISRIRETISEGILIEVEAAAFDEVKDLLKGEHPDIIMLDNMTPDEMRTIVRYVRERAEIELEASGGITLDNVRAAAETGVDRISIGEVTHSVKALDIGFYI